MELFYFTVGWVVSHAGFYVIHKLIMMAEEKEN